MKKSEFPGNTFTDLGCYFFVKKYETYPKLGKIDAFGQEIFFSLSPCNKEIELEFACDIMLHKCSKLFGY